MLVSKRRPFAALLVSGSLALVTAFGVLALPAPAHADEVAVAQARVDRLQDVVKKTTRELVAGTKRWEADQAALRRVQLQMRNTQRHVAQAEAVAAAGTARVSALARRLYMHPGQDGLQLAFTKSPEDIVSVISVRGALNQAAGSDGELVRRAQTVRLRLKNQVRSAEQLAEQARRLVARSAKRLTQLTDLAQRTADRLDQAQNALQKARGDRAARLSKARRAARERASRHRYTFAGGPACTGGSTQGQQNGNLDPASLCPLWMAPGQRLRSDAAATFNTMSKYHASTVGSPLCVTDSYRSYSEQAALYRRKPGLAAVPGTSNHGWGLAVDFCGGVESSGSAAYRWMEDNAGKFGWFHPDWARPSGSRPEAWHWEFHG